MINQVKDIVNELTPIKCTECNYCIEHCPKNIPIPKYFSTYNTYHINKTQDGDQMGAQVYYLVLSESEENGAVGDCIECNACVKYCPQHLEIPKLLKDVHKELYSSNIKRFFKS